VNTDPERSVKYADLQVPGDVTWIARTLDRAGFAAWAVGGGVRDALTGGAPDDWDLTTSARPADVQRLFRRTAAIGVDYGTVGVIAKGGMYEVTTFRRDVETFGRRARVVFSDSLEEDLQRRDFTINAIAWSPITKEVRDPHGGLRDLAAGILRTVGVADDRFEEDRLRVLRALRFAGRFGLEIEESTWTAIVASADKLGALSAERVRDELLKVLASPGRPSRALDLYAGSGVLEAMYPELAKLCPSSSGGAGASRWRFLMAAVDARSARRPLVRLALLLHSLGDGGEEGRAPPASAPATAARSAALARSVLQRLRMPNSDVDTVTHLVAQQGPSPDPNAGEPYLRRWIRRIGPEHLNDLFRVWIALERASGSSPDRVAHLRRLRSRASKVIRSAVPLTISQLAVSGEDLLALRIPPGPVYGDILRDLLEQVTDDPSLNEKEVLLGLVRSRIS